MLAGKILEIFSINPINPIKTPNRAKNHWLFFLCMSDAFESVWGVVKAPYEIILDGLEESDEEDNRPRFEEMYQGGKKGDSDTGWWHSDLESAIAYALFGSQIFDDETGGAMAMREGEPQLRIAPKTDKTYLLAEDYMDFPIGSGAGVVIDQYLPNEIMDSAKLWEKINEMAASDRDIGYGSIGLQHPKSSQLAHIDKLRRRYAP
mgnify:CR=1 FL=1